MLQYSTNYAEERRENPDEDNKKDESARKKTSRRRVAATQSHVVQCLLHEAALQIRSRIREGR